MGGGGALLLVTRQMSFELSEWKALSHPISFFNLGFLWKVDSNTCLVEVWTVQSDLDKGDIICQQEQGRA